MNRYAALIEKQNKAISRIGNLRLFIFVVGGTLTTILYMKHNHIISMCIFLSFLILFVWVANIHSKVINNKKYASILFDINNTSLQRLKGEWANFPDIGEEFIDTEHKYSSDLDIFGKNSIFQWINTSYTYSGRTKLKEKLIDPCNNIQLINLRQEAIKELSKKITFRQMLITESIAIKPTTSPMDTLYSWGKTYNKFYEKKCFILLVRILPIITIFLTILPFISSKVPFYIPLIMYFINSLILAPHSENKTKVLNEVYTFKNNLFTYYKIIKLIEKTNFESTYLKNLEIPCSSKELKKLSKISQKIALRGSSIYMIINIFLLWDYQCLISLGKWKKICGIDLKISIDSIGEIESLSSLSLIHFDNPDWVFPKISKDGFKILAENLGHPLLTQNRICNSLNMIEPTSTLLITGSNMSGKSTFLRTLGINLVLSYIGTPVCANNFEVSIMDIYTCMRISDSLEKNTSSFYAELVRIKMIVSAAKEDKKVFFLLDEIFKGTNSFDRHTGAKILIKQLQHYGAKGLISTHDLELGELENESNSKIKNYHFREYYKNDEIFFDYKLRPGISTTRNALYLLKLAGLETDGFI